MALPDLASTRLGGRALAASDDFFASKANLLKPQAPIFVAGKFTSRGKWMDGWESRRRRTPGHDWCVIRLGVRGVIHGLNVDTRYFTGNYPSHCSLDAMDVAGALRPSLYGREGPPWTPVLAQQPLQGDGDNVLAVHDTRPWTHLRLNIFPDGGVARLRVYGEVEVDWRRVARPGRMVDVAALPHGGLVLAASDMHFGAKDNMIMPGRARNMGDGWETRRRRGPGYDWAIVRLGAATVPSTIEIDTRHFKGNYPESASIEGCVAPRGGSAVPLEPLQSAAWSEILPRTRLGPDRRHIFVRELRATGLVTHVRLNIFPDGGISRLRVFGRVAV